MEGLPKGAYTPNDFLGRLNLVTIGEIRMKSHQFSSVSKHKNPHSLECKFCLYCIELFGAKVNWQGSITKHVEDDLICQIESILIRLVYTILNLTVTIMVFSKNVFGR